MLVEYYLLVLLLFLGFWIFIFIIFSCYFLNGKGHVVPAILKLWLIFLLSLINPLELYQCHGHEFLTFLMPPKGNRYRVRFWG